MSDNSVMWSIGYNAALRRIRRQADLLVCRMIKDDAYQALMVALFITPIWRKLTRRQRLARWTVPVVL